MEHKPATEPAVDYTVRAAIPADAPRVHALIGPYVVQRILLDRSVEEIAALKRSTC